MTFEQAAQTYAAWRQQLDAGAMPPDQFQQAVAQLRVVDEAGVIWQMDAATGAWLRWDGQQWVAAQAAAAASPPIPPPVQPAQPATQAPLAAGAVPARQPWAQRIWDVIGVAGSAALSAFWYWYTSMDTYAGADKRTCIAMLVIPISLIIFRGPIDKALAPLTTFKRNIPRMVLLGVGMATPVLVANFFYQAGSMEYGYMFRTYVFSTLLSYIILRQPGAAAAPAYRAPGAI
jgi:hypothetical protein